MALCSAIGSGQGIDSSCSDARFYTRPLEVPPSPPLAEAWVSRHCQPRNPGATPITPRCRGPCHAQQLGQGHQLCLQYLPHEAAEEAKKEAHEPNLIGDLGGDGLLAVGTHRLHGGTLEDLSLQHCHCGGSPRWHKHRRRVATRRGIVSRGRVVAHGGLRAWRGVVTCWE